MWILYFFYKSLEFIFIWIVGFPGGSVSKESAFNVGDLGSILGLGRPPGEGKGYPPQYSDLESSPGPYSPKSQRVTFE